MSRGPIFNEDQSYYIIMSIIVELRFSVVIIMVLCLSRDRLGHCHIYVKHGCCIYLVVSTLNLTNHRLSFMINTMAIGNSTLQLWITSQFTNTGFVTDKTVFISGLKLWPLVTKFNIWLILVCYCRFCVIGIGA